MPLYHKGNGGLRYCAANLQSSSGASPSPDVPNAPGAALTRKAGTPKCTHLGVLLWHSGRAFGRPRA